MRLDKYLSERYGSRTKAANAISKGLVCVNGNRAEPSYDYKDGDELKISEEEESYVSAGGYKLANIGASTGGFTDCLLKNGARKVYCIDVGESQLDKSLLTDKVKVIDNFNARFLNKTLFNEKLDGAVIDVSFISLTYILKAVGEVLENGAQVLALIKPQFECEGRKVGKNGIVKDGKIHKNIIYKICDFSLECGLTPLEITNAPIVKGKNLEYVIFLEKDSKSIKNKELLIKSVKL